MLRTSGVSLLLALAACDRVLGLQSVDLPGPPDGPPGIDAGACYGTGLASVCIGLPLDPMLSLAGALDTTSDRRCRVVAQTAGPELCVVAGDLVVIHDIFQVTGSRPLVVVASDTLTISGTLDVSSSHTGRTGPGVTSSPSCGGGTDGADSASGAGAGAGGSFGFLGGGGGNSLGGATGGMPPSPPQLVTLRGGCAGTNGGLATGITAVRAAGGAGGGAVFLIAGSAIEAPAGSVVNASGAGGAGGGRLSGGGGGGAGGLIGLDAPRVTIAGQVFARGGGGGGGGGSADPGASGSEAPDVTGSSHGGPGAAGAGSGGDGCGGPSGQTGGIPNPTDAMYGGGAGGGGCGIIKIYSATVDLSAGLLSPDPS